MGKQVNVSGTLQVAQFALAASASMSFVSSVAALPVGEITSEICIVPLPKSKMEKLSGYGQTKAVAEQLLQEASKQGLQVRIFRCGDIAPDRRSGYFNPRDGTLALVRACAVLKKTVSPTGYSMGWFPADAAAHSIVLLSDKALKSVDIVPECPRVFHLIGTGPPLGEVINALESRGYHFDCLKEDEWRKQLQSAAPHDAILNPALPLLERISFPPAGTIAVAPPCSSTLEALG